MDSHFIAQHKAKHLLAHVLAAAGARRWPEVSLGDSGETATGFYADFALPGAPDDTELTALGKGMRALIHKARVFRALELPAAEAARLFALHPWRREFVSALGELHDRIALLELEGVYDVCDCALKSVEELRALTRQAFVLTAAHPTVWSHRGKDTLFVRVRGELVPAPLLCACCVG